MWIQKMWILKGEGRLYWKELTCHYKIYHMWLWFTFIFIIFTLPVEITFTWNLGKKSWTCNVRKNQDIPLKFSTKWHVSCGRTNYQQNLSLTTLWRHYPSKSWNEKQWGDNCWRWENSSGVRIVKNKIKIIIKKMLEATQVHELLANTFCAIKLNGKAKFSFWLSSTLKSK